MEFGPGEHARAAWRRLLAVLREAIDVIGVKEAAYLLDVAPSLLSDALHERDRKNVQLRWVVTLLMHPALAETSRLLIMSELGVAVGFDVKRRAPLTTAEELARIKAAIVEEYGPAGERLLAKVTR